MTKLSDEFRQSLAAAAGQYHAALVGGSQEAALSYLLGRGITGSEVNAYQLGVVDGTIPDHASYAGWICIPYLTRLGGVVSLKFRRLDGGDPKYLSPYLTRIYNPMALDKAEELGYVAICEGEFDAIVLDALAGIPAVAIPGVETWKAHPEWREMFTGFTRVLIFRDQDEPGERLASQIMHELDTARIVDLPAKDVNQAYLDFGAERIREIAGV